MPRSRGARTTSMSSCTIGGSAARGRGGMAIRRRHRFGVPGGDDHPGGRITWLRQRTANICWRYAGVLNPSNTVGNYTGALSNSGERLRLSQPEAGLHQQRWGDREHDELDHGGRSELSGWRALGAMVRWRRQQPREGGPARDGRRPESWADSDESEKAPWTTVSSAGGWIMGMCGGSTPGPADGCRRVLDR
jgi:hypothetical protein